jgi:hypothetical protein
VIAHLVVSTAGPVSGSLRDVMMARRRRFSRVSICPRVAASTADRRRAVVGRRRAGEGVRARVRVRGVADMKLPPQM